MSRRMLIGASALGLVLVTIVILVAVFVPGENITRGLAVFGFLVALGKTVYDIADKERARRKKLSAASSPIELKVHDVFFRYNGQGSSGEICATTRAKAMYVGYWFKLSAFNSRAENVGLTDVMLHFAKGEQVLHQQVPAQHTGETRFGAEYCPEVTTITLPSREWYAITFQGGVGREVLAAIAECDSIYLAAKSTTGEVFRVQLANNIIESV